MKKKVANKKKRKYTKRSPTWGKKRKSLNGFAALDAAAVHSLRTEVQQRLDCLRDQMNALENVLEVCN